VVAPLCAPDAKIRSLSFVNPIECTSPSVSPPGKITFDGYRQGMRRAAIESRN
jgi:hypothetical protein